MTAPKDALRSGAFYFYIHFVTEVVCFYLLTAYTERVLFVWLLMLAYDMLAFVPQGLIGHLSDRHPTLPLGSAGLLLLALALLLFLGDARPWLWLLPLTLGNACTHINGAELTLRTARGKLFPVGLFVSGGSFGLVSGKLLAGTQLSGALLLLLIASALPLTVYAQRFLPPTADPVPCRDFDCAHPQRSAAAVLSIAVAVVTVRGFMAYGIPTSWVHTAGQSVLLFSAMGLGKALGGLAADRLGVKTTALCSTLAALPFLLCGDSLMLISLVGVLLFSMTMPLTLALLVSLLPADPGLAFGLTTIGLFLGTAPMFFIRFTTVFASSLVITVCTLLCTLGLYWIVKEDDYRARSADSHI